MTAATKRALTAASRSPFFGHIGRPRVSSRAGQAWRRARRQARRRDRASGRATASEAVPAALVEPRRRTPHGERRPRRRRFCNQRFVVGMRRCRTAADRPAVRLAMLRHAETAPRACGNGTRQRLLRRRAIRDQGQVPEGLESRCRLSCASIELGIGLGRQVLVWPARSHIQQLRHRSTRSNPR